MPGYKLGRRPPKGAPAILFADVRAAVVPSHPTEYDTIAGWTGWDILGNDQYGDCVAVSWSTERRIKTNGASYPNLDQVIAFYKTQNPRFPADDNGMDIQTALEHLVSVGGPDGVKALCFAKVDHTNLEEIRAALYVFGCLWLGVNVTYENQSQFPDTPWTRDGSIEGGHSIIGTGYATELVRMETWAREAALANDYVTAGSSRGAGLEEAWVVIWPEDAATLTDAAKAALGTAYTELTGKTIAWPGGPTPPTPFPGPTPTPADPTADFVAAAQTWLSHPHTSAVNRALIDPLRAYLATLDTTGDTPR